MNNKHKKGEHNIVIEIPVVLEKANVVFNMDHLAFAPSRRGRDTTVGLALAVSAVSGFVPE